MKNNIRCLLTGILLSAISPVLANNYTPNTFADLPIAGVTINSTNGMITSGPNTGSITLRSCIAAANAVGAGPHTITLLTGTYSLTIPGGAEGLTPAEIDKGDLDVTANFVTIQGAGMNSTIINQTSGDARVLDVNVNFIANFHFTIDGLTISGGRANTAGNVEGGGMFSGSLTASGIITVTDCKFLNNHQVGPGLGGGALCSTGGQLIVTDCVFGGTNPTDFNQATTTSGGAISYDGFATAGIFNCTNTVFINNRALSLASGGGAINVAAVNLGSAAVTITGCTFTGNQAPNAGGGAISNESVNVTVTRSTFLNNSANRGGAVRAGGGSGTTVNFCRLVGNTAVAAGGGHGLDGTVPVNGDNNWWGANTIPAGSLGGSATAATWLQLKTTASPSTICNTPAGLGNTSNITTSFLTNSAGTAVSLANLVTVIGLPVTWSATLGTLSGQQATIQANGTATALFTSNGTGGAATVNTQVDNVPVGDLVARANITVNTIPTVTNPANSTVCLGGTAIFTSTITGTPSPTIQWRIGTTVLVNGLQGSGSTVSGQGTNTLTITNVQFGDASTDYNVEATNECGTDFSANATLTVNPIPDAAALPVAQTICSEETITTIVLTGSVNGTVFNWTRDNTGSVTGIADNGSGDITGALTNTTNAPVTVTFTITPSFTFNAVTCTGTPITATVLVNPTPDATATPESQAICSGETITTIALTGNVSNTTFNWTRDNTGSVTGIADNGSGDISGALTNTTNAPVTVTFTITPTANNCSGTPITATAIVNPIPDAVATPSSQTICSEEIITTIVLTGSVSGTSFNWTRDNAITVTGPPDNGAGDISGSLTNATNAPVTVTFTITPSLTENGITCTGTPITATVLVNPKPDASATPLDQTICSGEAITTIALTGSVSGTAYNWTRDNTGSVTGIADNGSGDISGALTNTTGSPVIVTFTITPTANNCPGTPIFAIVTVNPPAPTITGVDETQPTCATPTGTIVVNATGTGTLEYSIDGGTNWVTTNSFSGLAPGSYDIAVRSQSFPDCIINYSGNPVVLEAATGCTASPANDLCANATPITCGSTTTGTTVGATADNPYPVCGSPAVATPGVWYSFVGTGDVATLSLSNCTGTNNLQVFTGTCSALTCVAGTAAPCANQVSFIATTGTTYLILVNTKDLVSSGTFDLTITCAPPLPNDDCANAIPITCGSTTTGTTIGATNDFGISNCFVGGTVSRGVWYSFVGTGDVATLSTCTGTDFDTRLRIYTNTCAAPVCLNGSNNSCGLQEQLIFNTTAGTTYFILLDDGDATQDVSGNFTLSLTCSPTPDVSISVSPASVAEDGGTDLVYTFTRTGSTTNPLTVNFSVSGTASFTEPDYSQAGAASFGPQGTVTFGAGNANATVTVDPTPDINVEPDETVILNLLSGPGYAVGSPSSAIGTITNDDAAFDPCADITPLTCGIPVTSTHTGAGAWDVTECGVTTPGQEKIYSFAATVTGTYTLEVTVSDGNNINYFYKAQSDGCNANDWICIGRTTIPTTFTTPVVTLTAGTAYYILLESEITSGSHSQTFQVNCPAASTTTTVSSNLNPSCEGNTVTFTATVTSGGNPVTTGTVTFREGATILAGPVALNGSGQASFSTSTLSVGPHTITANYNGAPGFIVSSGSMTQTVNPASACNAPTSTVVTSSLNPSCEGNAVTFTATVTSGGNPVTTGSVTFAVDGNFITVALNGSGQATLTNSTLTVGPHTIEAQYNGSTGFNPSLSAPMTQTVNSCATAGAGDRVWNDTDGDGVQDGGEIGINGVNVELLDNSDIVQATTTTSGDGNYAFTGLAAGTYKVRVVSSTLPAGAAPTYDLDGTATPHIATFTLTTGQTRTDVDFGYNIFDPCASITPLTCGIPVTSTHSGPGVWNLTTCFVVGTAGQERVYSFTPAVTGTYNLEVTAINVGYIDYFYKAASDGCDATDWICINDVNSSGVYTIGTLTAGTTYYILADAESAGFTSSHTFKINCPAPPAVTYTIFPPNSPGGINQLAQPREVGVKFRVTQPGFITGIRFYKGAANTGIHTGHLWSNTGTSLASVIFTGETASGWQQALFSSPVAVIPNVTYMASYYTPTGNHAITTNFFTSAVVNGPLRALASSEDGGNGHFRNSAVPAFPNTASGIFSNFWVDVVFTANVVVDNTPPTVISVTPPNGATGVPVNTTVTATFSEDMNAATIGTSTFELHNPSNVLITATVTYNAGTKTATLTPSSPLANSTLYTATVKGGASGVKDLANNPMVSDFTWSFTTAADVTPPIVISTSPVHGATGVNVNTTVIANFNEAVNPATVTTTTYELKNGSTVIPATVSTSGSQITLTPLSPLAAGTLYTGVITGGSSGVTDLAGNPLASNYSWTFTTAPVVPVTTYNIFSPGSSGINQLAQPREVGVKFRVTQPGFITGIRFYKGAANTGIHTGHLWSNTGTSLASVIFTGETASGWQQALFSSPVAVIPNVTYMASYYTPTGNHAITTNFFTSAVVNGPLRALASSEDGGNGHFRNSGVPAFPNTASGIFSNFWVDVVFATGIAPKLLTQQTSLPAEETQKLSVQVTPNPSESFFKLVVMSDDKAPIKIRITDISGRVLEHYEKVTAGSLIEIGKTLKGGAYFAEVIQGNKRRVVKIIKVN